jgi:hypothetical protein
LPEPLRRCAFIQAPDQAQHTGGKMNVFYIIGVIVVVIAVLSFLGLR